MGISLNTLFCELKEYNPKLFPTQQNEILLQTVELLEVKQSVFEPNFLYIGKTSSFPKEITTLTPVNILCITNDSAIIYQSENSNLNINLLVLEDRDDIDLALIFNKVQSIFLKQQQNELNSAKLLKALIHGKGIQHIIDVASELLGNPIALCDLSFKMLFCTQNIEFDDPYWKEFKSDGYFSFNTVSALRIQRFIEQVNDSEVPIYYGREKYDIPRIISRITIDHKIAAYIAIHEYNRHFNENDKKLFSLLCDVISSELHKSKFFHNSKGVLYESFITDILDGSVVTMETVTERLKYLEMHLKENIYILTVRALNVTDNNNLSLYYLRDKLELAISGSKSIIYDNTVVLIISRSRGILIHQNDIKALIEFLKNNKIYGGLSRCFHKLTDARECYFQAQKSLEYGIKMTNDIFLFLYEDYVLFHLFDICSSQKQLKDFCHVSMFKLMEYDRKNKTNYTKSLDIYLTYNKTLVKTADVLQIHRKTMASRVEMIEEIMDVDLDNPNTTLHLLLTFQMLKFIDNDNTEPD